MLLIPLLKKITINVNLIHYINVGTYINRLKKKH